MHPAPQPLFSRALLALTAAATIAVAPLAAAAIAPADSGHSAHSIPVYLISRISHDVGHNDWAFQGQDAGRVSWVATYAGLALFWLAAALWIRTRSRRPEALEALGAPATALTEAAEVAEAAETRSAEAVEVRSAEAVEGVGASVRETGSAVVAEAGSAGVAEGERRIRLRLWLRVLLAAWAAELVTGLLTLGAGAYAEWTSTPIGADVLKVADLCSPWWSCVAAVLVVARAERSGLAVRAIAGYAVLLAVVLLVPLPGPDALKVLLLAVPAAIPALLTPREPNASAPRTVSVSDDNSSAAAV